MCTFRQRFGKIEGQLSSYVYFYILWVDQLSKHIYRVTFNNQQDVYEIYVKHVFQGDLYGFVVVEGFLFNETSEIVVDPAAEKIKAEFGGVKRTFLPMHEIIRIDQVEKKGIAKIRPLNNEDKKGSNIANFYSVDKNKQGQ